MIPYVPLLPAGCPLVSRELARPLRLASLAVGVGLLVAGSVYLPSTDWDIPLCFVMALPAYVLAPWAFRQVCYFRWRWLVPAAFALWAATDGTYSLYWWLRGFDALAAFRPANFAYCVPLFWASGFVWNVDVVQLSFHGGFGGRRTPRAGRLARAALLAVALTAAVGVAAVLAARPFP